MAEGLESMEEEKLEDPLKQRYDFTKQVIIKKEALNDLKVHLVLPAGEKVLTVKQQIVASPPPEFVVKARVTLINRLVFDCIQEIQKDARS